MGFFSKWVYNLVRSEHDGKNEKAAVDASPSKMNFGKALNITVYNAHGGKIVMFHSYNEQTNKSQQATYIIHPDEDFSESLAKLIAVEEIKYIN